MELNPQQKQAIDVVMKYSDLYCMSCHDSENQGGDINIEQFHQSERLASDSSMIGMFVSLHSKEDAPSQPSTQPTIQERAEMVTAQNAHPTLAPKEMQKCRTPQLNGF